ncbi:maleate cis-trans isomerase family protein [Pseudodonghicola flavimaris]|uniref:Aspartate/glutamate racemase family protein n=1 Tax=Pseudodonghicola flavimaris TaxID=3050036 RepID=A0ABT7F2Q2_9RHOB|nr:aspartate/glutamate racemase family protein [Pseudodonghicola flavimaris]MDK3018892.1 aspartate/glutamate racemase family protein [Pseudodonghicola flavimaris]
MRDDGNFTDLGILPATLDGGAAARAAVGLIVLATDQTMELEFRRLLPLDGVGLYCTRVHNDAEITPETLRAIGPRIPAATELILPGLPLDVVGFGCTSATMTLGEDYIFDAIRRVRPGIACTTPITAAVAAFAALGARRIGVLTPYAAEVNAVVRRYLEDQGVPVAAFGTYSKLDDREAARIDFASIEAGVAALAEAGNLDAVFISCTSMRLSERVAQIEAATGLAVTSSDHALAWHCLRLAGIEDSIAGAGRLFTLPLA